MCVIVCVPQQRLWANPTTIKPYKPLKNTPKPTSSTAKASAPWGRLSTNWAPAPRVRMRKLRFCSSVDPFVCSSVLTTLAGCMAVCAQLFVCWLWFWGGGEGVGFGGRAPLDALHTSIRGHVQSILNVIMKRNHLRETAPASMLPQKVSVESTCSAGMPSRRGPVRWGVVGGG